MALDSIDVQILNMLIENGRISYTDIAKEVGMKPPSVIDRIKKMESDGLIYDYTARVDYRKMGFDMVAFVGVVMDNPVYIDDFENILCAELYDGKTYFTLGDLYINKYNFSILFDKYDYKKIKNISYLFSNTMLEVVFMVTNVSVNGSQLTLTFNKQINGSNTATIDLGSDLDTIMNSIKTYSYLSDKENYNFKIVILTILIYASLQANGIIPAY